MLDGPEAKLFLGTRRGVEVSIVQVKDGKDLSERLDVILSIPPHVNVISYSFWAKDSGHVYLVSEFIPHSTLDKLLVPGCGGLSLTKRVEFATQIVSGMNWLHESNPDIVHGNLCPKSVCLGMSFFSIVVISCKQFVLFFVSFSNFA